MPPRRAIAVTYVRSALSMALPAGSAASVAYAFQVYRRHGYDYGVIRLAAG